MYYHTKKRRRKTKSIKQQISLQYHSSIDNPVHWFGWVELSLISLKEGGRGGSRAAVEAITALSGQFSQLSKVNQPPHQPKSIWAYLIKKRLHLLRVRPQPITNVSLLVALLKHEMCQQSPNQSDLIWSMRLYLSKCHVTNKRPRLSFT